MRGSCGLCGSCVSRSLALKTLVHMLALTSSLPNFMYSPQHATAYAARRSLPPGKAPFAALLGVHGRGVSHGGGDEGGADCCYALHTDGSLTVWLRTPGAACAAVWLID